MKSPKRWIATALMTLIATTGQAGPAQELGTLFADAQRDGTFNGVALIRHHGRSVLHQAYGSTDASGAHPLSRADRFNIGSIGKEFSAVALLRLGEAGKLRLDDSLAKYLPDLPPWAADVPVRTLLDYTSGLPELDWKSVHDDAGARASLRAVTQLLAPPGTAYSYTYMNVMARQFVVESITGRPFANELTALMKTCGMRHSVADPDAGAAHVVGSFSREKGDDPSDRPVSGMPYLTAADLLEWERCLQNGKLVSAESLASLGQAFGDGQSALGEAQVRAGKLAKHVHHGTARNYEALLRTDADSGIEIVLLTNSRQRKVFDLADRATAILARAPPK